MMADSFYGSLPIYVFPSPGAGELSRFVSATAPAIELMTDSFYEDPCAVWPERQIDFYECFYGDFPVTSTVERNTTGWLHSWNAGLGFEFALQDPASFFVEARYVRIGPPRTALDFVPIRVGLRF